MNNLTSITEFEDWDIIQFKIGALLGIFEPDSFIENKYMIWGFSPSGKAIHNIMEELIKIKFLETNGESEFRYNKDFKLK